MTAGRIVDPNGVIRPRGGDRIAMKAPIEVRDLTVVTRATTAAPAPARATAMNAARVVTTGGR